MLNNKLLINKREHMIMLSFLLVTLNIFCQKNDFYTSLNFKKNIEINNVSNNPYKLITECFFNKTLDNEILWGYTKFSSNYSFNSLNLAKDEVQNFKIDVEKLKLNLTKKDYDDLLYYGFSTLIKSKKYTLFDVGNNLYLFTVLKNELSYHKQIHISDTIDFNFIIEKSDTTIILLDYRASFDNNNKIKTYTLNLNTSSVEPLFEVEMSSNSACFDRANTKYFDINKNYFILTDNLDYKIHIINQKSNKLFSYYKPLEISEKSRSILNPKGLKKNTLDSISSVLDRTPRIINTQFINDSDVIVNYSLKAVINVNGIKIKNSMIDLLTIRGDSVIFKKTFNDEFCYEKNNFKPTEKINQSSINPYLRSELYHFTLNNFLVKISFQQLIPKSNTSFEKYIRKAKASILNLKSNLIFSIYEFHF